MATELEVDQPGFYSTTTTEKMFEQNMQMCDQPTMATPAVGLKLARVDEVSYAVNTAEIAANDSVFSGLFNATCKLTADLYGPAANEPVFNQQNQHQPALALNSLAPSGPSM